MAVFETVLRSDLKSPLQVVQLGGNLFSADNEGNKISVEVFDNGSPATLSGNVTGYVIRADNATVAISGTLVNNKASIVLPTSAYTVVGHASIVIKVGTTTVGACTAYVYRTTTDTIVDPAHVIPSIAELLEKIADCEAATTAATTAATNANTKAALADEKATLANTKAALADEKATAANTAAGTANAAATKIDDMTVAANRLSAGATPTATISEVSGHKHILFGIPKGDPGKDFHIAKTFASIAAMEAYTGTDIEAYDFAMIDTGSVQDADTGKLYCYEPDNTPKWRYIGDLSGSQGIKGETGNGIASVVLNNDYTLTITYTDGTTATTASIRGATGATPSLSIGTVTTGAAGSSATVTITGTTDAPVLNFTIPKGDTGSVSGVYGTTIEMSEQDSTKVTTAINGKADKVASPTSGHFAGLDSNGNLTDSGKQASDFKTKQSSKTSPSASGNTTAFIDTITQNTNGEITATKKSIQTASSSATGLMPSTAYSRLYTGLPETLALVQNGTTATVNIPQGTFVYRNNNLYVASMSIQSGATINSSYLTPVVGLNETGVKVVVLDEIATLPARYTVTGLNGCNKVVSVETENAWMFKDLWVQWSTGPSSSVFTVTGTRWYGTSEDTATITLYISRGQNVTVEQIIPEPEEEEEGGE